VVYECASLAYSTVKLTYFTYNHLITSATFGIGIDTVNCKSAYLNSVSGNIVEYTLSDNLI
jgi:hypothetical protein